MHSSKPPMPSAGADSDRDATARARAQVGEMLASRGVFGLVWLDDDLIVRRTFGTLVEFVTVDAPLAQSVPACIGLEDEIKTLSKDPESALQVPNVSMIGASGPGPRLNLAFHNLERGRLMVVSPAGTGTTLEVELGRQIRARLMAEAAVAAKSQELAQTNADLRIANTKLEQFASIVTHDLKAPMRALRYMADDIHAAIGADDDHTACSKLDELRRQSTRLSTMLSALLRYSSAGPREVAIERVDTRALVSEIVESLPANGIGIDLRGTWPSLDTFAAPLDLTLRNLIDNAIKHHDGARGHVLVTCSDHGDALELSVADDGPGIAPEYQDNIFLPFRSLSSNGEGIGLAIVHKMVGAVGGTVRVDSDPAQQRGTTFTVHWPKIGL
jgi:signal transduction histidine kinase